MTEQELRELVRRVVARRLGSGDAGRALHEPVPLVDFRGHPSHGLLHVAAGAESGGPCIIESHVGCNHCGYCKSFGH